MDPAGWVLARPGAQAAARASLRLYLVERGFGELWAQHTPGQAPVRLYHGLDHTPRVSLAPSPGLCPLLCREQLLRTCETLIHSLHPLGVCGHPISVPLVTPSVYRE